MRHIVIFIFLVFLFSINTLSQQFLRNSCDSAILTKEEFEKCKIDSIWTKDIVIKTNYISSLKTELLPKYKLQRQKIQIPEDIRVLVIQLKHIYDSTLNYKMTTWKNEMDKNQRYVQPKAYISSLLSFELFKFYPDTYAILLNDVHLSLNPKASPEQLENIKHLCDEIIREISQPLLAQLKQIVTVFQKDKLKLTEGIKIEVFQAEKNHKITDHNIIDFLMWVE